MTMLQVADMPLSAVEAPQSGVARKTERKTALMKVFIVVLAAA
jgi:hypothetical protein